MVASSRYVRTGSIRLPPELKDFEKHDYGNRDVSEQSHITSIQSAKTKSITVADAACAMGGLRDEAS